MKVVGVVVDFWNRLDFFFPFALLMELLLLVERESFPALFWKIYLKKIINVHVVNPSDL